MPIEFAASPLTTLIKQNEAHKRARENTNRELITTEAAPIKAVGLLRSKVAE